MGNGLLSMGRVFWVVDIGLLAPCKARFAKGNGQRLQLVLLLPLLHLHNDEVQRERERAQTKQGTVYTRCAKARIFSRSPVSSNEYEEL